MIRYFAYIDVPTIESFYNQSIDNFVSKKVKNEKGNVIGGKVDVSLKNVIRGFFNGGAHLEATRSKLLSEELEVINTIENKVIQLLSHSQGDEKKPIDISFFSPEEINFVSGTIRIIEEELFLKVAKEYFDIDIQNCFEFVNLFWSKKEIFEKWKHVEEFMEYEKNGVDILELMNKYSCREDKVYTFMVLNDVFPIIMRMSANKITMPHSSLTSSALFCRTTVFNFLGIASKENGVYALKPLALWNIMGDNECSRYVYDERFS